MQNSITTRVSDQAFDYLESKYKNKFQGSKLALESFPIVREEAIKNIKGLLDPDEIAFLLLSHKGQVINNKELASRRSFEAFIADYFEENTQDHQTFDFAELVRKIRELGSMERFVLRELVYTAFMNPGITDKMIDDLTDPNT